jgi:hypothetical protein
MYLQDTQDDLPAAYGTSHDDSVQLQPAAGSGHTAQGAETHNPLAPVSHDAANPLWQHYPEPPAASATQNAAGAPTAAVGGSNTSASGAGNYPSVPTPAVPHPVDFNVPLGSPASTVSNSGTPSAAAVGAAAAAMAMAAAANSGGAVSPPPVGNPELRIAVHNPLRHMGPSGLVPGAHMHTVYMRHSPYRSQQAAAVVGGLHTHNLSNCRTLLCKSAHAPVHGTHTPRSLTAFKSVACIHGTAAQTFRTPCCVLISKTM